MPRAAALIALIVAVAVAAPVARQAQPFAVEEATIAAVHAAMRAGRLTCRALVDHYLRRIGAFDKNGPAFNAIVLTNPRALEEADALDARFKQSGPSGPLHCVPLIVKDNFETVGLQSANGSLALEGFVSTKDAFQVKRVKDAGALVLAKSNMAEWAFSPYETIGSILPGYSKNPYALDRVTAGSSGGTAAAVAANFGLIGLGSDTGNSIRGPSSHQALVGIRSTMGLTSRAGVMPLNLLADIAGPMGRTVEDVATVVRGHRRRGSRRPGDRRRSLASARELPRGVAARRIEGRAHRRAAPGLRPEHGRTDGCRRDGACGHHGSGDRRRVPPGRGRPRARRRHDREPRHHRGSRGHSRPAGLAPAWDSSTTSIVTWPRTATACR